ncbi:MAG: VWA domain-containing protein [Pyrinomonadaceae bacterium]
MNKGWNLIRTVVFAFAVIWALPAVAAGQSGRVAPTSSPTPHDDTERVLIEEIKLNVLAFDEHGGFFKDVTANDLVITENNVLHQPASVRRLPANVLIVMDTGGELRSVKTLARTRKVAGSVVNSLRPGDSVAIMTYSDKAEIVAEWSDNKEQIFSAIKKTSFGRRSVFVDALKLATDFLLKNPIENKHLVLITDGTDSRGRSSDKFDAFQRLMATDISVHVLSYTSMEAADVEPRTKGISKSPPPKAMPDEVVNQLPNDVKIAAQRPKIGPTINLDRSLLKKMRSRKAELELSEQQLDKLSENTNGEFVVPMNFDDMENRAAPLVARMIDSAYVVTYTPKVPVVSARGVAERTIDVSSRRPGLIVQARRKVLIRQNN